MPPREGLDEYADFPVLRHGVRAFGGAWGEEALQEVGRLVGSAAAGSSGHGCRG
ncbi:hypothetical protein ACWGPD_19295 [Streptomyces hirsutus]